MLADYFQRSKRPDPRTEKLALPKRENVDLAAFLGDNGPQGDPGEDGKDGTDGAIIIP